MRCGHCGYSLWRLSEPRCPECGEAFDLRDYSFTPGTVAFACPDCGHLHGGAGPQWVPTLEAQARCLGCGGTFDVRRMAVQPTVDDLKRAEARSRDHIPWESRGQLGFWKALFQTWGMGLSRPAQIGRGLSQTGSILAAYGYVAILYALQWVAIGAVWATFLVVFDLGGGPGNPEGLIAAGVILGAVIVIGLVGPLLWIAAVALPAHFMLMVMRQAREPFGSTIRAVLYGSGWGAIGIPAMCCPQIGIFVYGCFLLAGFGCATAAVATTHRTSGTNAFWACAWLPLLVVLLIFAAIATAIVIGAADQTW